MSPAPLSPAFTRLAWANLAAQSAEQISLAAVPIVAVLALGAGPGEIGALATAQTLPFLLLSIPAGLLADRWSRRRLMVLAEGVRALALIGLLLATAAGQLSFMLLALLGFIGAAGTVGFSVAAPALVPALVPVGALAAANGRLELARSAAYAAGPALAGALVAWTGAASAFVLAAMLSASALALLLRLPEPPAGAPRQRKVWDELRHGAGLVWTHELLRPILFTAIAWNIAWFVLQAAYVPYAMRSLGLDASGVGVTLACYGAGMVLGALCAARVMRALSFGSAILLGPFVSVLASLVMLASIRWPSGAVAALSFFLFGVGPIIWTISSTTLRQTVTPMAVLGQVSAIFLTVNMGARPLGAALGGMIGAAWGEQACLVVAAVGFVVQATIITCSRVRTLRQLPAAVGQRKSDGHPLIRDCVSRRHITLAVDEIANVISQLLEILNKRAATHLGDWSKSKSVQLTKLMEERVPVDVLGTVPNLQYFGTGTGTGTGRPVKRRFAIPDPDFDSPKGNAKEAS